MKIVCISDTHGQLAKMSVPDGDVLVHAGDATMRGTHRELYEFAKDMSRLAHSVKIFVAGNHDLGLQDHPDQLEDLVRSAGIVYLRDSGVTVGATRFWGSPWQPEFHNWAFNLPRGPQLAAKWALIPKTVDVLVTHGPPYGVLDVAPRGGHVGCADLAAAIVERKPAVHVFGHIHECYGQVKRGETLHVNASSCNSRYQPVNPPIAVEV